MKAAVRFVAAVVAVIALVYGLISLFSYAYDNDPSWGLSRAYDRRMHSYTNTTPEAK